MKNILVPTDFSQEAEYALKVAAQIAKKQQASIYLLHLLQMPLYETDAITSTPNVPDLKFFMEMARERFEELSKREYLKDLKVHEIIKIDVSFNNISKISEEHGINLIVMASNGSQGLEELIIGSNAEKVVRTSHVPVLVVKDEHKRFSVKNMIFASDFKNDHKETFNQASYIAKLFGAKLHLLMVNTPSNFTTTRKANQRINDFIEDPLHNGYSVNIYNDQSVEAGILNFAQDINADLIGISTHGRQGIAHLFNGSISEDLVNHAKRPVMTFKI